MHATKHSKRVLKLSNLLQNIQVEFKKGYIIFYLNYVNFRKSDEAVQSNWDNHKKRRQMVQEFKEWPCSGIYMEIPSQLDLYTCQKLIIIKMVTAFKGYKDELSSNALIESSTGSGWSEYSLSFIINY